MRRAGLPKVYLSLSILALTVLSANTSVTRLTPEAHVYQIQLLGRIMLVCPESFGRKATTVDCARWLRRTRGGSTVFVKPILPPEETTATTRPRPAPRIATAGRISNPESVMGSITRPRPRPDQPMN